MSTDAHCNTLDSTCIHNSASAGTCKTASAACDYATSAACTFSLAGQCKWNGETCGLNSAFTSCANIVLTTAGWTTANCEGVLYSCKKDTGDACIAKACADYTKTDGLSTGTTAVSTDAHCSTLDSTCTIDLSSGAVKCQTRQANCTGYTAIGTCTKATEGNCIWNSASNSGSGACEVVSATNCNLKTGANLTDTDCATHNAACIPNRAATAC